MFDLTETLALPASNACPQVIAPDGVPLVRVSAAPTSLPAPFARQAAQASCALDVALRNAGTARDRVERITCLVLDTALVEDGDLRQWQRRLFGSKEIALEVVTVPRLPREGQVIALEAVARIF